MVRESRLAWNDGDGDRLDDWRFPVTEDDEDAPLDPPPKRRCTRRGRALGRESSTQNNPDSPATPHDRRPAA